MKKQILISLLAAFALAASAQFSKPRRNYVEWLVMSDRQDRTYQAGQKATITVEAYKGGNALDGVTLHYKVGDEMFLPEGKGDSTVFRNGKATIDMGTRTEPGFKACETLVYVQRLFVAAFAHLGACHNTANVTVAVMLVVEFVEQSQRFVIPFSIGQTRTIAQTVAPVVGCNLHKL